MAEQSQGSPYVSEVQATVRSGFAVRAQAPILIQQQRSFTNFSFQVDDTDNVDSVCLGPDQMEEVATAEESCSSISMHLILNLNLRILF